MSEPGARLTHEEIAHMLRGRAVSSALAEQLDREYPGWRSGVPAYLRARYPIEVTPPRPGACCERDHDGDGNCDRHPERRPK